MRVYDTMELIAYGRLLASTLSRMGDQVPLLPGEEEAVKALLDPTELVSWNRIAVVILDEDKQSTIKLALASLVADMLSAQNLGIIDGVETAGLDAEEEQILQLAVLMLAGFEEDSPNATMARFVLDSEEPMLGAPVKGTVVRGYYVN
jgi:hypothetical protein